MGKPERFETFEEVDSINREDTEAFTNELRQSVQEVNNDLNFNGRVRLRNHTADPGKGKVGEIVMVNSVLKAWDNDTSAWVAIGGGGSSVVAGHGTMTAYTGVVTGTTGAADEPFPTGWTSSRTSTGVYVVTHNFGDSNSYTVSLSMDDTTEGNRAVYERDPNSFDVEVTDENGNPDDGNFSFLVIKVES